MGGAAGGPGEEEPAAMFAAGQAEGSDPDCALVDQDCDEEQVEEG